MAVENTKIYTQNWDAEYLKGCKEGLKLRDANNDGYTTADEMIADNNRLVSVFKNQSMFSERADELMNTQASIFQKYAGNDGILSSAEYANCINSPEWKESLNTFHQLDKEYQASFDNEEATQQNAVKNDTAAINANNSNLFSNAFSSFFNKIMKSFNEIISANPNDINKTETTDWTTKNRPYYLA